MLRISKILTAHPDLWGTPAFKAWFAGSKVVDEDGNPLKCYHGTSSRFKEFKGKKGAHLGYHFGTVEAANERIEDLRTTDEKRFRKKPVPLLDEASRKDIQIRLMNLEREFTERRKRLNGEALERTQRNYPQDAKIEDDKNIEEAMMRGDIDTALSIMGKQSVKFTPEEMAAFKVLEKEEKENVEKQHSYFGVIVPGENIIPVYLRILRPLDMIDAGNWGEPRKIFNINWKLNWLANADTLDELREAIINKGYDGIRYENTVEAPGSVSYIIFDSNQAKSAVGNKGTFSLENRQLIAKKN